MTGSVCVCAHAHVWFLCIYLLVCDSFPACAEECGLESYSFISCAWIYSSPFNSDSSGPISLIGTSLNILCWFLLPKGSTLFWQEQTELGTKSWVPDIVFSNALSYNVMECELQLYPLFECLQIQVCSFMTASNWHCYRTVTPTWFSKCLGWVKRKVHRISNPWFH